MANPISRAGFDGGGGRCEEGFLLTYIDFGELARWACGAAIVGIVVNALALVGTR